MLKWTFFKAATPEQQLSGEDLNFSLSSRKFSAASLPENFGGQLKNDPEKRYLLFRGSERKSLSVPHIQVTRLFQFIKILKFGAIYSKFLYRI